MNGGVGGLGGVGGFGFWNKVIVGIGACVALVTCGVDTGTDVLAELVL